MLNTKDKNSNIIRQENKIMGKPKKHFEMMYSNLQTFRKTRFYKTSYTMRFYILSSKKK